MTVPVEPVRPYAVPNKLAGKVVFMYAFDVAYEMHRQPVHQLLGHPVQQFAVDLSKRGPKQLFFYRPQMLRLPTVQRTSLHGTVDIERSVKLLPVGAIAITISVPFAVEQLQQLVGFHDLRFADGTYLYDEVRKLAEDARKELAPYLNRPVPALPEEEAYTVFCLHSPVFDQEGKRPPMEKWLVDNRRAVASLLTEETDPTILSDQEAEESTSRCFSYYKDDLVVVDWDAALIVNDPRNFDEILYIMELANVQLAELEAYDRILDEAVDRAYRDLSVRRTLALRTTAVQRELREIRVDLARSSDELSNITKFFGDWHLARVYAGLSARFHLTDWHHTIDEKLKTLDELYQLLRADQNNRWMFALEIAVVILFVIELMNSLMHWSR